MPRVPQILSSGEVGGAGLVRASPALADTSGIEHAIGTLGKAAQTFTRVDKVVADENAKVEAELALGEMQRQAADAEIAMRDDPGVTPDNYAKKNDENLRAIQQGVGKSVQSPEARMLFQRTSARFITEHSIKGKWEGLALRDAAVKAGTDTLLQHDATDAVFAPTDALRQQAFTRGLSRIEILTAKKIYTGTESAARLTAFRATVTEGGLKMAARDPTLRGQVIDSLLAGEHPDLGGPDKQLAFAENLMKQQETATEKQEKEMAAKAEAARKAQVDTYESRANVGRLPLDELEQARENRVVVGDDYRRLYKTLREGSAAGGRTDDEVYNRIENNLLENPFAHSAKEIRAIQEAGKLAQSGPRSAATLLKLVGDETEKATRLAAEKDITQQPMFKQGLHELQRSLRGGAGPLESLTREQATRLENGEREYHDIARSGRVQMSELPEAARKIVDRLRRDQPAMMGDPERVQQLRYQTPRELFDTKKAGMIPEAEFNRQFKLMQELGLLKPERMKQDLNLPDLKKPTSGKR